MTTSPVGICSRKRAEHLMMAASVAGGAIYVHAPQIDIPGTVWDPDDPCPPRGFLAIGTMPDGSPVPDYPVDSTVFVAAIRKEIARLDRIKHHAGLDEWHEELSRVLADVESKLGDDR